MLHYTLNTGHTYDTAQKDFEPEALAFFEPLLKKGSGQHSLPAPFQSYQLKYTLAEGFALFDLYGKNILSTNMIAWSADAQKDGWKQFRALHFELEKKYKLETTQLPVIPAKLPWLATLTMPSPEVIECPWLADLEQCFAKALLRQEGGHVRSIK